MNITGKFKLSWVEYLLLTVLSLLGLGLYDVDLLILALIVAGMGFLQAGDLLRFSNEFKAGWMSTVGVLLILGAGIMPEMRF
jgi:uncharacterized membrane protein YhiD involved in acid resistance